MQREGQKFFIEVLIVHCSRNINNQVKAGQKWYIFNSVTALAFLDFDLSPSPTKDYIIFLIKIVEIVHWSTTVKWMFTQLNSKSG